MVDTNRIVHVWVSENWTIRQAEPCDGRTPKPDRGADLFGGAQAGDWQVVDFSSFSPDACS
jgi:hypothetical protein